MPSSLSYPIPLNRSSTDLISTEDSTNSLPDSATTLRRMSPRAPQKPRLKSSATLGLLSLVLHLVLVALHLTLVGIWAASVEHRVVFSLDDQKTVSFFLTTIAQTFGTVCLFILNLEATVLKEDADLVGPPRFYHPNFMDAPQPPGGSDLNGHPRSCSGLDRHWKTVAASLAGTLAVFLYLGNILVLHISTPALFSLQAFNLPRPLQVNTNGLPSYNISRGDLGLASFSNLAEYVSGSPYYLPSVLGSTGNLGLNRSTLYDVLDLNSGSGNVTVQATGFNITCRYLKPSPDFMYYSGSYAGWIASVFYSLYGGNTNNNITFYSTTPVIDSQNDHPPEVNLSPPMNATTPPVSSIQFFQCWQSLVNQTAVVDAQSRLLLSVEPEVYKKTSMWLPSNASGVQLDTTTTGNSFIDMWEEWFYWAPQSIFPLDTSIDNDFVFVSVAEMYIIQKLNLHPANISDAPITVMLHDLENTLAEIVAGMFWTLGNIQPTSGPVMTNISTPTQIGDRITPLPSFEAMLLPPKSKPKRDWIIIAIATGLTASVILAFLTLPSVILNKTASQKEIPIEGTGMLHAIWLYRNDRELEADLEQVEHPTDENLRQAGMVKVRWTEVGKREKYESF
ncbi:hypothetical protein B0H16DRAFT_1805793 [Mycena metata]|uniref:Uncharacterized protein n=1 Tax=Mycena metata TaxID=1033252 RepID=A0AAD7NIV4_9AGAR|nr:hypothetical protein B0H16DRAFT_1805793 [Mycena metata]